MYPIPYIEFFQFFPPTPSGFKPGLQYEGKLEINDLLVSTIDFLSDVTIPNAPSLDPVKYVRSKRISAEVHVHVCRRFRSARVLIQAIEGKAKSSEPPRA